MWLVSVYRVELGVNSVGSLGLVVEFKVDTLKIMKRTAGT
jgi:hypothetical protein